MSPLLRFTCNTKKISHETIDGEVVIINLESGAYYSLENTAAKIWDFVENGFSREEIVRQLDSQYQGDSQEMKSAIDGFLKELQMEDLILPADNLKDLSSEAKIREVGPQGSGGVKPMFEIPTLQKYTDMQELLLLDPIHEVDEAGWPHAKPDQEKTGV